MMLSENSGTSFEQPSAGSHAARCIGVIDLGTQRGEYLGEPQIKRQIVIRWELPNELMQEGDFKGKPFTVGKFYTASLSEKATLRKELASWRGRDFTKEELAGFDPKALIGKACMLAVSMSDKGKAKVTSVMGLPKGMTVPPQINQAVYFSLDANEFKHDSFEALSKGFKEMIVKSPEYMQLTRGESDHHQDVDHDEGVPAGEDDIPF